MLLYFVMHVVAKTLPFGIFLYFDYNVLNIVIFLKVVSVLCILLVYFIFHFELGFEVLQAHRALALWD